LIVLPPRLFTEARIQLLGSDEADPANPWQW
jgi:hypothetical protein